MSYKNFIAAEVAVAAFSLLDFLPCIVNLSSLLRSNPDSEKKSRKGKQLHLNTMPSDNQCFKLSLSNKVGFGHVNKSDMWEIR